VVAIGEGMLQKVTANENLENVWQLKDLQTRFSDVWQAKELQVRISDVWQ
jgi:hypothetical protein